MNFELFETLGKPIKAWTQGVPVEDQAKQQLKNLSALPFIFKHIAVMPDVHYGMGATVGSVIATQGAVIPAAVGVDIGCGMIAVRTSLTAQDLPDNLSAIRSAIEAHVPHGRTDNGGDNDKGSWIDEPHHLNDDLKVRLIQHQNDLNIITAKHPKIQSAADRFMRHAGTLGGGNHFIEICLDEQQNVWIVLHSGSRGIGNRIGSYFIELAKQDMKRWFIQLPDADLAYIPHGSTLFGDYCKAVAWAQMFALTNRDIMLSETVKAIRSVIEKPFELTLEAINCHHNYISHEDHFGQKVVVTRKGAVRAGLGELGIIPGSMGAKSFIVRGKGNAESFCSCSHGAGRQMSRNEAKRSFSIEDHIQATQGIECRKDVEVIDETPMAYKDIDAVMNAQADLVEVLHTLKQVVCVKG